MSSNKISFLGYVMLVLSCVLLWVDHKSIADIARSDTALDLTIAASAVYVVTMISFSTTVLLFALSEIAKILEKK